MSDLPSNNRITRWVQNLLDLTLRNRLLNLKDASFTMELICTDAADIEDRLVSGSLPLKNFKESEYDTRQYRSAKTDPDSGEVVEDEPSDASSSSKAKKLPSTALFVNQTKKETDRRLLKLYRQTKTDISEGGVNTLFLTIGTLHWRDKSKSEKEYLAPIILLPVELIRNSVKAEFRVQRTDDDPFVNPTLLEALRRDFQLKITDLSEQVVEEKEDINVKTLLDSFTEQISSMTGWKVEPTCWLGRFSFDKFIMYTDLNNRWKELAANPVVKQLINLTDEQVQEGTEASQGGTIGVDVEQTSAFNEPPADTPLPIADYLNLFLPIAADASQRSAVIESTKGRSFVLYGPPGTGKSQTITNLIAYNLAMGKKVLFVSEKRAALEVVYNRLSKIGLGPYCLELHSNKAVKRKVLDQFQEVYEMGKTKDVNADWTRTCSELTETEQTLDNYVRQIHKPIVGNISAYDCFGWLASHGYSWTTRIPRLYDGEIEEQELPDLINAAEELQSHAAEMDPAMLKALSPLKRFKWNPELESQMIESASAFRPAVEGVNQVYKQAEEVLSLPDIKDASAKITLASQILEFLQNSGPLPSNLLSEAFGKFMPLVDMFVEQAKQYKDALDALKLFDINRVLNLRVVQLNDHIEYVKKSFFMFRFMKKRSVVKEYASLVPPTNGKLTFEMLEAAAPKIAALQESYKLLSEHGDEILAAVGDWNGESANLEELLPSVQRGKALREILSVDCLTAADRKRLFDFVCEQTANPNANFAALNAEFQAAVKEYRMAMETFNQTVPTRTMTPIEAMALIDALPQAGRSLRQFSFWTDVRNDARRMHLGPLAKAIEQGKIDIAKQSAAEAMEASYRWQLIYKELEFNDALNRFDGVSQNRCVERFCSLDDSFSKLSIRKILLALSTEATRAAAESTTAGSPLRAEGDLLRREMNKKMRFLPIRSLLERAPNLTRRLKPCFLMSPLSVAQYLPTNDAGFDLVVFDEASQIPTWDAVGVIARANNAIIVGDPKQLPPTAFFQRQDAVAEEITEQNEDEVEDMESILDECIAIGMDGMKLNTHYRSKNESLIAFSNHYYYQDELDTFPSPDRNLGSRQEAVGSSDDSRNSQLATRNFTGVHFEYVPNAVYDKSKTRTNKAEAQRVVEIVLDRLSNPKTSGRSMGVVAFSAQQKDLIEDMLDQAADSNPELANAMSEAMAEPLFVKNLENVQGDERDCIIFSIGYAPDATGAFAMNFGPLNKSGGQRRLNVAVTRAKEEIIVVSSIYASQIDLNRTSAVGPAHLKAYLEFAQSGRPTWSDASGAGSDSSADKNRFIQCVANFLRENGYEVDCGVGFSDYKIDIAIVDPKNPNRYCLAVECDGAVYKNAKIARDREKSRPSMLEGLGWKHCRVWSTEWFTDPEKTKEDLLKCLKPGKKD